MNKGTSMITGEMTLQGYHQGLPQSAIRNRKSKMLRFVASIVSTLMIVTSGLAQSATNDLGRLVQQGLFEEEANHNLDAAAKAYQAVISQYDKDRTLAATAIFRLGEVYRKQGKTNDANAMYERIVREFSDQPRLAQLSRELAGNAIWVPGQYADPQKVIEEAKADAAAGNYRVALAKHVWYFENALKFNASLSGVRLSFALSEWIALGAVYPPALEKLKSIRDDIEKSFREGEAWRDPFSPFMDFAGINRALEEPQRTKELFAWLDANKPAAAARVYPLAEPALIEAKEFALCGKYIGPKTFENILRSYKTTSQFNAGNNMMKDHARVSFINSTTTLVALLALNNRQGEADQVAEQALKELDDAELRDRLAKARKGELPAPLSYSSTPRATEAKRAEAVSPSAPASADARAGVEGAILIDNTRAQFQPANKWQISSTNWPGTYGADYHFTSAQVQKTASAVYRPEFPNGGRFHVEIQYAQGVNRNPTVPITIAFEGGTVMTNINQQRNGGEWLRIASDVPFAKGNSGYVEISNGTGASPPGTVVVADAVRFLPAGTLTSNAADLSAGSTNLFNGRDLTGWSGNPDHWSVRDGVITGVLKEALPPGPPGSVSALVWRGGSVGDFELSFKFRFDSTEGAAAVEYRARKISEWDVRGYRCGLSYKGNSAGFLSARDRVGLISFTAKTAVEKFNLVDRTTKIADLPFTPAMIESSIRKGDWNECVIVAQGNHLIHKINGNIVADLLDNNESRRRLSGLLAFTVSTPSEVQFKDIQLKRLESDAKP